MHILETYILYSMYKWWRQDLKLLLVAGLQAAMFDAHHEALWEPLQ